MANRSFMVEVVTPARIAYSQDAEYVSVPGVDGSLGVLVNHAPLLAALNIGILQIRSNDVDETMAISGGFLEVKDNKATILANAAEKGSEIDVLRAQQAKERAERRLAQRTALVDTVRAEAAFKRAVNRLKVAGKL